MNAKLGQFTDEELFNELLYRAQYNALFKLKIKPVIEQLWQQNPTPHTKSE